MKANKIIANNLISSYMKENNDDKKLCFSLLFCLSSQLILLPVSEFPLFCSLSLSVSIFCFSQIIFCLMNQFCRIVSFLKYFSLLVHSMRRSQQPVIRLFLIFLYAMHLINVFPYFCLAKINDKYNMSIFQQLKRPAIADL